MSHIAIVGAGPAAFYTAEALKRADAAIGVDLFERLPMPFGLARFGIAPDHPRLKAPITAFERIGALPGVRFFGGVEIGRDLPLDRLRAAYDAVVLAHGAQGDEALVLPGASPGQVRSARALVDWYNGRPGVAPDAVDLQHAHVVVIGHGNVAIDIARLLSRPAEDLALTDISDRALAALRRSAVREVHLVGRRGPVQARFTTKELRELAELHRVHVHVAPGDLALQPACSAELDAPASEGVRRNLDLLRAWAARPADPSAARHLHLHFGLAPERIERAADGTSWLVLRRMRLEGPPFAQRAVPTDAVQRLRCDLVVASIGFRVEPMPGLDVAVGPGLRHDEGRVQGRDGMPLPGLYVAGWSKRGPSGVLGSNRSCAEATVQAMLADRPGWPTPAPGAVDGLLSHLRASGRPPVEWADWCRLDALERQRGAAQGRPRVKLDDAVTWQAMLGAREADGGWAPERPL